MAIPVPVYSIEISRHEREGEDYVYLPAMNSSRLRWLALCSSGVRMLLNLEQYEQLPDAVTLHFCELTDEHGNREYRNALREITDNRLFLVLFDNRDRFWFQTDDGKPLTAEQDIYDYPINDQHYMYMTLREQIAHELGLSGVGELAGRTLMVGATSSGLEEDDDNSI